MSVPELFQLDEDKPTLDLGIEVVNVRKCIDGRWTSIPRQYDVGSMSTEVQLFNELGPGSYELIGRNQKGQIVRRPKITIAPPPGWVPPAPPAAPPPVGAPVPTMGGSPDNQILVAIIGLMGQNMAATSQMVTAMLQMNGQNSREHVAAMGQMFNGFATAQTSLLERVMANAGGKDPQDAFLKGVETAAEIRRGADESRNGEQSEGAGLVETVQAVAQGVDLAQKMGILPGATPPAVPS